MIPKRVVLENFLSFASPPVAFDFTGDDEALWVITGPNGCGKSAVFDAITYALFECHRGSDTGRKQELLMRHGADHCRVILEFDFAGHSHRITRGRSRSGKTTKPVQKLEERTAGGEWRALDAGESGAALNQWVIGTLGLDYDAFTTSVLLKQGAADKLLSASKEDRLKILKGIIGFEQYEALSERVRVATQVVRAGATQLKHRFANLVAVTTEELAASRLRADETDARRGDAEALQTAAIGRVERAKVWQKCHARRSELEHLLAEAEGRAGRAEAIRQQKARADELGAVVPLLRGLVDGREELAELQDSLEGWGNRRGAVVAQRDAAQAAGMEIRGRAAEHAAAFAAVERELGDLGRDLVRVESFHRQSMDLERLAGEVSRFPVDLPERLSRATEAESDADGASRSAENALTEARTLLKTVRDEQTEFEDVRAGVNCSRCGQAVSPEHAILERTRMADSAALWQTLALERQVLSAESHAELTRARSERVNLGEESANRNRSFDKFEALRANLTEQGCAATAAELMAERGTLERRRASSRDRSAGVERSKRGADAEALAQDALGRDAAAELAGLEPRVAEATAKRAGRLGRQTSDAARLPSPWIETWETRSGAEVAELAGELDSIRASAVEQDYQKLLGDDAQRGFWTDDRNRVQAEIDGVPEADRVAPDTAEAARAQAARAFAAADVDHRAALHQRDDELARAEEYRRVSGELRTADSLLTLHETLGTLLGDKGLQLDLVRGAETEVIALADDTLRRLSNQELSLEVDEDATGPNLRAFALRIRKAGEAQPTGVDFISGSQRFRVAVSLALAIGRFASGKQRPLEAVIIDEGFGSLDKDGLRAMAENLHELRRTQSLKRIILVSHQESFTDQFATGYRLTPGEAGTTAARIG